jgi:hypothetical protein
MGKGFFSLVVIQLILLFLRRFYQIFVYKKSEKESLADNQYFAAWRPEKKPVQQQI